MVNYKQTVQIHNAEGRASLYAPWPRSMRQMRNESKQSESIDIAAKPIWVQMTSFETPDHGTTHIPHPNDAKTQIHTLP